VCALFQVTCDPPFFPAVHSFSASRDAAQGRYFYIIVLERETTERRLFIYGRVDGAFIDCISGLIYSSLRSIGCCLFLCSFLHLFIDNILVSKGRERKIISECENVFFFIFRVSVCSIQFQLVDYYLCLSHSLRGCFSASCMQILFVSGNKNVKYKRG